MMAETDLLTRWHAPKYPGRHGGWQGQFSPGSDYQFVLLFIEAHNGSSSSSAFLFLIPSCRSSSRDQSHLSGQLLLQPDNKLSLLPRALLWNCFTTVLPLFFLGGGSGGGGGGGSGVGGGGGHPLDSTSRLRKNEKQQQQQHRVQCSKGQ
jgi:hypothetical protein